MSQSQISDELSIAVVGMAGRFPGADDVDSLWRNVRDGVESISFFSDEELEGAGATPETLEDPAFVRAAGVIDGEDRFDAEFFGLNPREAEILDPQQRLLLETAWQALEDAGYDPESFDGTIGVFAGVGMNTYFLNNVLSHPEILRSTPALQVMIGADKDYVAPQLSYKLNLKGPSVSVQSACSTSLVAVHLGCQSLQDFQSDLVLVGGCSLRVPQRTGYWYQEGGIFSPDGHCRAFDASAAGTVGGSGVGVVALRRLEDALDAGDRILAVIRGSAINNDGSAKVGFTAPSVEGQVAVVAEALAAAGVDGESISYVEAHGTGTAIGDPIEVSALAQAFEGDTRRGACALGSLKTNVGHLDTAAGVAGLIKTVQALRHRQIPPSLHLEAPHPDIDFESTPFFANGELREWSSEGPRRAGVSSFGIGGTNAHVVVEEAPVAKPSGPSRDWQLLPISARTRDALDAATENLAGHLKEHDGENLADVAYTLQTGRRRFEHRRVLVCSDPADAAAVLSERDPERLLTVKQESQDRPAAFLFPGQGAQYAGMTHGLYDSEATFRKWVDAAAEGLEPRLGLDLRQLIYPSPEEGEAAASKLAQTALTQPALFAVEHALAQLWMEWGVSPAAMLGHSIGEYVAATLSGVMSFDDALALVAGRGRLMQSCPEGAMLAVPLTGEEVEPLLSSELSLAAINGPKAHVIAGPSDAVDALAEKLKGRGVEARRLRTSHAFHSASMDGILDEFGAEARKVKLNAPEIPFISCVSGTWITDDEATDADYWVRQLRGTVRFGDGLAKLFEEPAQILLECGPGRTLATLARAHGDRPRQQAVVECVRHPGDEASDQAFLLRALGRLWLAGVRTDWEAFSGEEDRRRVALPTYAFERQRFWLEAKAGATPATPSAEAEIVAESTPDVEESVTTGHQRPDLETEHVAPRNATEEQLAVIWQETLAVENIGVYDDFFELGGHSLLATQISDRTRRTFRVNVPLVELFTKPTIAAMAVIVDQALAEGGEAEEIEQLPVASIDREKRGEPFVLTDVQQAYWIGRSSAFELGGVATHIYSEFDVPGIDPEAMTVAWRKMIDRHDMLRAIVLPDGRQRILEEVLPYEIETLDLTGESSDRAREAVEELRQTMSQQVLPADQWPLFELRTTRLPGGKTRIHISFDMLIGDAWSWEILTWEFGKLYSDPDFALPPIELSFRDYVLAAQELESSPAFDRDLEYWRARLPDFPGAPELPLARSPMSVGKPRFERLATRLEPAIWGRLKERATVAGLTPSGMLLAAFAEVLSQWSKVPRFALNLTLFNRLPLHPEVGSLIGDFTSLTLLEVDNSKLDEPFSDRAQRLQAQLWEDLDHRLVSAVRVLRELARAHGSPARAMMPVVFTSTLNMSRNEGQGESEAASASEESAYGISQTPQVWIDHQVNEHGGSLYYNWDVVKDLFPDGLLENMFGAYTQLLVRLAEDDDAWNETRPQLVPPAQLAMRLAVADTAGPIPDDLLHSGFAAQARSRPEQPAVIDGERTLSYDEVARRAHSLALRLRELGASPNRLVAVSMSKGWEQIVAVLGVLEAGAAYLPIDPELPEKRRFYLLENGKVEIVLTQGRLDDELAWPENLERLAVDRLEPAEGDFTYLEPVQSQTDLAYVIFTSGSTGEPKGVMIDHRGAANTVADVNDRFSVGPEDRVLAVSSLSFDLSVWDIFGTLSAGGAIVLPPSSEVPEPAIWSRLLIDNDVTIWNSVPALMELLVDYAGGRPEAVAESLRLVMMSGDWIPVSLPDRLRRLRPDVELISMGGATEASIWSILYPIGEVGEDWTSIPYGRAMRNQSFHVLDHRLEPRPVWVPGELYIGGIGLAQGYWRDEEKTNDRFIIHPNTGERLYRTGDLGRFQPDGDIQFLGREDFQVKVRGYRIELGEIEAALTEHPSVREAVVTAPAIAAASGAQPGPPGDKRLVAYFLSDGDAPEADDLRAHLRESLPDYMVPSHFIRLEGWPLTPNGKVDRGHLPLPGDDAVAAERPFAPPETETEEVLVEICSKVLGVEKLSVHDDFFELGGDSLMATRVIFEIRKAFEVELPVLSFFDAPTIVQLAEQVEDMILAEIESLEEEEVAELL